LPGAKCIEDANTLPEATEEPQRVTVSQILVKHRDAKRAPESITRTREQACLRAAEALAKLKEGAAFDELVADYSDEAGAATRGGGVGKVARDDVAPRFALAAFALKVDQVSNVAESDFGFHIILRTD